MTHPFRGVSAMTCVGLLADAPQRIAIDLEYDCPNATEPVGEIASVVNYDSAREEVAAITGKRHFNPQETLCREIMRA